MDLNPKQLSSLAEMGIPVWALRTKAVVEPTIVVEPIAEIVDNESNEVDEQLANCQCVVVIDSQNHSEQAQTLLNAMLATIGFEQQQIAIINAEQLNQLQALPCQDKVLFVLGGELLDEPLARGKIHQTLPSQINTVISLSLDTLLTQTNNKAEAWQDLQLIKSALN